MTNLVCPACDSDDLASVEQIIGHAPVTIKTRARASGVPAMHYHGRTDLLWDTTKSIGIHCRSCGWERLGSDCLDQLTEA
jgi:hypothetical protein